MGKSLSGIIAREKSRSNVLYPRAVLVLGDGSRNVCSTSLRSLPFFHNPVYDNEAGGQHWWCVTEVPPRPLEVRSGRIKSYFNVNAVEASVRAG